MNNQTRPRSIPKERILAVERILQPRRKATLKDILAENEIHIKGEQL